MSHFGDYMDQVPVKISEKYKRPPRILDLPYSVTECPARAKKVIESAKYSTTFENNVLSKVKELRSAKEVKKNERRHRLQLLEEAKQKKLDAIAAAEAEEKLKQLSVSEVSYPSTDEISAMSTDDKVDKICDETSTQEAEISPDSDRDMSYACVSSEPPPNILQPIQVQSNYQQSNLLDDPDPLQELRISAKMSKMPQYTQNIEALTFKDFENDTSSPFDNVELKTINEMEQLAQVLQTESTPNCQPQAAYADQTYPGYANCGTQAQMEGVTYVPNAYMDQPMQGPGLIYATPPHYPMTNGYYIPEPMCNNSAPVDNMYMHNFHYIVPAQPFPITDPYYNNLPSTSREVSQSNGSSFIPQPYYFHCPHVPMQYMGQGYTATDDKDMVTNPPQDTNQNTAPSHSENPQASSSMKSRSRSVPDIVQELNEELTSNRSRGTELAVSPGTANSRFSLGTDRKLEGRYWVKIERLPNPIETLPEKQQRMCENIHAMGFPLDRVARMCSVIGDNDKKIIESLLILGELMDLGFLESKAADALVKHEFNRDKALDELLSK